MGLFSDLFGSSTHSQTTSSTSNVTNTQLAGGGIGGSAVYGSGNTVIATDSGAVAAATDISHAALALGNTALETEDQVAISGLTSVQAFGDSALDKVSKFASSALDSNTYIAGKALDSTAQAYSDALGAAVQANSQSLQSVESIASQVSQSSQQVTDQTVTRIIVYLVIGVVAVMVLPKLR